MVTGVDTWPDKVEFVDVLFFNFFCFLTNLHRESKGRNDRNVSDFSSSFTC